MLHYTSSLHLLPSTDQKFKYEKLSHPAYGVAVIGKVTTHRGRKNTAYTPAHHVLSVGGGCFVWGGWGGAVINLEVRYKMNNKYKLSLNDIGTIIIDKADAGYIKA